MKYRITCELHVADRVTAITVNADTEQEACDKAAEKLARKFPGEEITVYAIEKFGGER